MKFFPIILVAGLCHGCTDTSAAMTRYQLSFQSLNDRGLPISNMKIAVGETLIGSTGPDGRLRAQVNARAGDRFPLHAPCPDQTLKTEAPAQIVFQESHGLSGEKNTTINVRVVCSRHERVAAVLVHADGYSDMPILIDGQRQGRTGPGGFAHLRLDLKPGSQFQVALDSSAHPRLQPSNPRQTLKIGSEDALFVFEPVFSQAKPARKSRRPTRPKQERPAPKKRPIRID